MPIQNTHFQKAIVSHTDSGVSVTSACILIGTDDSGLSDSEQRAFLKDYFNSTDIELGDGYWNFNDNKIEINMMDVLPADDAFVLLMKEHFHSAVYEDPL